MNSPVPGLRMFAGPNGSGKSTIKSMVPEKLLGVYLNPDEIQKDIETCGFLDVTCHGVETTAREILAFFANSKLLQKAEMNEEALCLRFTEGKLCFHDVKGKGLKRVCPEECQSFSLSLLGYSAMRRTLLHHWIFQPPWVQLRGSAMDLGYG